MPLGHELYTLSTLNNFVPKLVSWKYGESFDLMDLMKSQHIECIYTIAATFVATLIQQKQQGFFM